MASFRHHSAKSVLIDSISLDKPVLGRPEDGAGERFQETLRCNAGGGNELGHDEVIASLSVEAFVNQVKELTALRRKGRG